MAVERTEADPVVVEGLSVGHGGTPLLEDVSFRVRAGEVFAILGGSGSGKSTLLRTILGLLPALGGRARVLGEDPSAVEGERRIRLLNRLGVMYQQGALFGSMTLLENVSLPLEEFTGLPPEAVEAAALLKLKLVGLEDAAGKVPAELSGGMRKRAAIARALALDPPLLFLDEPSAGLDPITSAELDELILRLSRGLGITFVVVTHELESVLAIAGRAILLDAEEKRVVAEGDPRELKDRSEDPRVRRFFRREPAAAVAGKAERP